jgi:hypothetical protein
MTGGWRIACWLAATIMAAGLGACGSISEKVATPMSEMPGIGLPDNSPSRPAEPMVYPAVHDIPPPRTSAVLTEIERRKFEADLTAAREQQLKTIAEEAGEAKAESAESEPEQAQAKTNPAQTRPARAAARPQPPKTKVIPSTSSATIY